MILIESLLSLEGENPFVLFLAYVSDPISLTCVQDLWLLFLISAITGKTSSARTPPSVSGTQPQSTRHFSILFQGFTLEVGSCVIQRQKSVLWGKPLTKREPDQGDKVLLIPPPEWAVVR